MSTQDPPAVRIFFDFYGKNFDPAEITRRLNMEPTRQFKSGDPIPPLFSRNRRRDGWLLEVGPENTFRIDDMLDQLKAVVTASPEKVKQVTSDLDVEAVVTCEVQSASRSVPSLYFPDKFIQWAAACGAAIDVDIMLLEEEEKSGSS